MCTWEYTVKVNSGGITANLAKLMIFTDTEVIYYLSSNGLK